MTLAEGALAQAAAAPGGDDFGGLCLRPAAHLEDLGQIGGVRAGIWHPAIVAGIWPQGQMHLAERLLDGRGVTIGAAGLVNDARSGAWPRARLLVLSHGLLIESIDLSDGQRGFLAVVDVPLPRDLSQTVVTRSHEFDAMLASVYAAHAWIAARHVYTPRQPQPPQPSLLQRFLAAVNAMINPPSG